MHIRSMIYGYARVSTDGQSVDAQVRQLTKAGCKKVFRETASGAKTDRSQLRKALNQLDVGDVLMVTRLDRLGPVENQGVPMTTVSVIQAPKGVCHGPVQLDGCAMGEDAAFLPW